MTIHKDAQGKRDALINQCLLGRRKRNGFLPSRRRLLAGISPWGAPLKTAKSPMPWRSRGLSFLLAIVLVIVGLAMQPPASAAKTEEEIEAEIAQIEEKIQAKQKEIDQLRTEQADQELLLAPLQAQIKEVEAKAKLIDDEIKSLNHAADLLRTQIKDLEREIGEIDKQIEEIETRTREKLAQIEAMQKLLQERLRKQYMDGPVSNLQLLLSSPDLSSLLTVTEYLSREAERDAQLRHELEGEMAKLEELQSQLEEKQAELEERKVDLQKQSAVLVEKIVEQEKKRKELEKEHEKISVAETEIFKIINGLERQTKEAQSIIAQQRREQDAFERELDAIVARKFASGEISQVSNSGRMIWPFPYPGCYITSRFGATSNRNTPHKGLDVSIADKSKRYSIIAALDGVIVAHGFDRYMGNYVMIYHGLYEPKGKVIKTTYMHMASFDSSVIDNTPVKAGKVIGIMGSTGNSTGPHLHFQINEYTSDTSSVPVDPLKYISNPY